MRKRSEKEKEQTKIRALEWYKHNKERKKLYDTKRREEKFEMLSEQRKSYNKSNKEKIVKKQHEYNKKPENRFKRGIRQAKNRGIEWAISLEDYLKIISKRCFYDKVDLHNEMGCGLDRIDNEKGYFIENVVQCCGNCNTIRGNKLTHEEMQVAMKAVLRLRGKK